MPRLFRSILVQKMATSINSLSASDQTQPLIEFSQSNNSSDDIDYNILSVHRKKPAARLDVILPDGQVGRQFLLYPGKNYVGRDPESQVCFDFSMNVSKKHACIELDRGEHLIFDCSSLNKTIIRNKALTTLVRYQLEDGMLLKFGDVHCTYVKLKQSSAANDQESATSTKSLISNILANHLTANDESDEDDNESGSLEEPCSRSRVSLDKSSAHDEDPLKNSAFLTSTALAQDTPYFFTDVNPDVKTKKSKRAVATSSLRKTNDDLCQDSPAVIIATQKDLSHTSSNNEWSNYQSCLGVVANTAQEKIAAPKGKETDRKHAKVEKTSKNAVDEKKHKRGNRKRAVVLDAEPEEADVKAKLRKNESKPVVEEETIVRITRSHSGNVEADNRKSEEKKKKPEMSDYRRKRKSSDLLRTPALLEPLKNKPDKKEGDDEISLITMKENTKTEKISPKGRKRKIFDEAAADADEPLKSPKIEKKTPKKQAKLNNSSQRSSSSVRNSQKSVKSTHYKIAMTGFNEKSTADITKVIKKLGGTVVDSAMDCTVLIAETVKRTEKLLCAVAQGIPVVTPEWITVSREAEKFLDCEKFILRDDDAERLYKFNMSESLKQAKRGQLFTGYTFFMTPSIKPEPLRMSAIVASAGGKVLTKFPTKRQAGPKTLVITCLDDREYYWDKMKKIGLTPVSAELVLTGILQQSFDISKYIVSFE